MKAKDFFSSPFILGRKRLSGRFAIPSGIRCVRGSAIAKCFIDVPSVGVVTTKSISFLPREGYREPVYARFASGSYINAVGLANPGAEQFLEEMKDIAIPEDKFLLVSIFGANLDEFERAAKALAPIADGLELNLSCPHASGYGIEIGQDISLCTSIMRLIADTSAVPVFAKLSTSIPRIDQTAKALVAAGAAGITISNSVGPATVFVGDRPILHNRVGGLSGNAIRPMSLLAIQNIRQAIGPGPVIIGMGGIATAEHVLQFRNAGADIFGIGSALTGLDSQSVTSMFSKLQGAVQRNVCTLGSESPDGAVTMSYERQYVVDRRTYGPGLFEIRLDSLPGEPLDGDLAGRYYFLFIPGIGEKPFAVFSARDRAIVVREVGIFTSYLASVPVGAEILVRGPYGQRVEGVDCADHYLCVGGGTGIASLLEIGYQLRGKGTMQFILGARTASHVFGLTELQSLGQVNVTTDDGSMGETGRAPELQETILATLTDSQLAATAVIICGPDAMVRASIDIGRRYLPDSRILASIEYPTSCGVGICGKCASPSGHLTCIDGPFLSAQAFDHDASSKIGVTVGVSNVCD